MFTNDIVAYLEATRIPLRLACMTRSGWPMILSLWYEYTEGALWCATQRSSRIIAYLQDDARCAFEIAADLPPYCGVRGQGQALIDPSRGAETLERLLVRYVGSVETPLAQRLLAKSDTEVALIIKPLRIFTWNFTSRMQEVSKGSPPKVCPK